MHNGSQARVPRVLAAALVTIDSDAKNDRVHKSVENEGKGKQEATGNTHDKSH